MQTLLLFGILFFIPSVAFAHSGSILKVAINYLPWVGLLIPLGLKTLKNFINKLVKKWYEK